VKTLYCICSLLILTSCASQTQKRLPASSVSSVLYIGDSQSAGPLGALVYEHLQQNFHDDDIRLYGVGSSSPRHWASLLSSQDNRKYMKWLCSKKRRGRIALKTKVFMQNTLCGGSGDESVFSYLNQGQPDLVVFQFLGNSMKVQPLEIRNHIHNLLGQLGEGQKCLWITSPPYYRGANGKFTKRNQKRVATEDVFVEAIESAFVHRFGGAVEVVSVDESVKAINVVSVDKLGRETRKKKCHIFRGMKGDNWSQFAKTYKNYYRQRSDGSTSGDGMHFNQTGARSFYESFKDLLP